MLEIRNLAVRYGAVSALRGIDIDVAPGESVAVLGPNGAGKTSLMRCLAGLVKPASGTIRFGEQRIDGMAAHRVAKAGFALVPEGRGILSPLTVRENLVLGAHNLRMSETDERIEEMCELFPVLGQRLHGSAGLLSGGEQQMLAIARALLSKPRLLALDEPSMGLAPAIVDRILETLRSVAGQGTGILLAEQNAALALDVADRTYVLVNGEIATEGSAAELGDDLLERYLA
jgi:branched-chain amino acid transport system ATP-binding protein